MNQLLSETESERPWQLEYADDTTEAIDEQLPQTDGMAEVLLADLGELRREIAQERRRASAAERERDELRDYTRVILQFVADSLADVAGPGASGRRQWRVWLSWARIPLNAIGQFVADSLAGVAGPGASGRRQWRVWLSQTLIALVLGLLILGAIDFLVSGDAIPILSEPNPTATLAAHGL